MVENKETGKLYQTKTLNEILKDRGIEPRQYLNPCLTDKFIDADLLDEAKAEIFASINAHIERLVEHWKSQQVGTEGLEKFKQQCYVDAYLCIKHNILDEDAFKLRKWFGVPRRA